MTESGTARGMGNAGGSDLCYPYLRTLVRWLGLTATMALLAALPAQAGIGRDLEPVARIPLARMGYQTLSHDFLLAGSSMLTVDFVDKDHLLVTFWVRRLMKREVDDPAGDEDRTVGAFLVEVSTGKVLARTEWRVHDRSQYLWSLGHGRFLLRVHDALTMFAPLDSADPDQAFRETPLLRVDRHIVAVMISSDNDLLTVETTKWRMGSGEASQGFSAEPAPVQINFYRLQSTGSTINGLRVVSAGTIRTRTAVALPMTTAGRLDVLEGGKNRWLFNFNEHAGKVVELSPFDTTCFPRPTFVGHSEFVAFGCHGGPDKPDFAGFNMKGEEMWQQNFYDTHVNPTFAFAPEAGRFALGRTIITGEFDPEIPLPASMVSGQEVRVYQNYNGKQLFRIECTPVERAGQNFALSSDGMRLAVVRETLVRHPATKDSAAYSQPEASVEVYALPALTPVDQAMVKEAQALAPADTGARIDLALQRASANSAKNSAAGPTPKTASESNSTPSESLALQTVPKVSQAEPVKEAGGDVEQEPGGEGTAAQGDPQPATPRKPPTLYGPDEKHKNPQ